MTLQRCFLVAFLFITILANAQWENSDLQFLTDNFMDKKLGSSSMQLDELGNVHLVYHQENSEINELWYAVRTAEGELQNAIQINDPQESLFNGSIGVINSENVFISYVKETGGVKQIFVREIKVGEEIEHQITKGDNDVFTPHAAIDNNAIFHLTWVGLNEEGDHKIFYSNTKFIGDTAISEPVIDHLLFSNVNDPTRSIPNIALPEEGLPHIIYICPSGEGTKVQYGFKQSVNGNWINSFISQSPNKYDFKAKISIENNLVHTVYAGYDSITGPSKVIYTSKEINESIWGAYAVVAWEKDISLESFVVNKDMVHLAMLNSDKEFIYANNKNGAWENNSVLTKALNQIEITIDAAGNGLIIANHPTAEAPQIVLWGAAKTVSNEEQDSTIISAIQTITNPNIKVFPNPSSDYLNIESDEFYNVQILDITGKQVWQTQNTNTIKLNINNWAKGHYIVRLFNDKTQSHHKIIIR